MLAEFCRHQGMLKGYIFSAIRDYYAAEDILQEIAILVTKKASDFDFDRPVAPWLTGIAKMYIRRWFQQSARRPNHISFDMLDQCLAEHHVFDVNSVVFSFERAAGSTVNTTQIFEYSSDLSGWTQLQMTGDVDVQISTGPIVDGMEPITVTIPKTEVVGARLFGRIRVLQN